MSDKDKVLPGALSQVKILHKIIQRLVYSKDMFGFRLSSHALYSGMPFGMLKNSIHASCLDSDVPCRLKSDQPMLRLSNDLLRLKIMKQASS